jgi:hypothetical protein
MPNYGPSERRQLGRPLNKASDEAETSLQRITMTMTKDYKLQFVIVQIVALILVPLEGKMY